MPNDFTQTLVVGVSSRALFDLAEANEVYEREGKDAYASHQLERENELLRPGTGFPIVRALLELNKKVEGQRLTDVIVMSRNSPATSVRLFQAIKHYGLDIARSALSGGAPLAPYLRAFSVDLYLTADEDDVKNALAAGFAAAVIYESARDLDDPSAEIRIAFDCDSVVFSDEADQVYEKLGMQAFLDYEVKHAERPLPMGPFGKLLKTISRMQNDPRLESRSIRIALITARSMPAHLRVINTLRAWNIDVDEAFFLGGLPKTEILSAFRPHIFFDDQESHCVPASAVVSTARVPRSRPGLGIVSETTPAVLPVEGKASTRKSAER